MKARRSSGYVRAGFKAIDRIALPVAILTLGIAIYAVRFLPDARLDSDPMALRDPSAPSVQGFDLLFNSDDASPYKISRLVSTQEDAVVAAALATELSVVKETRSLMDFVPTGQDEKLELIDFASSSLFFALNTPLSSEEGKDIRQSVSNFQTVLVSDPERVLRLRLADALSALSSDESLAAFDQAVFRFWPEFLERVNDQFNADYVELEMLPTSLRRQFVSGDDLWRVDILPAADLRDDEALRRFVDNVEALTPDISGGAVQSLRAGDEVGMAMVKATVGALIVIIVFLFVLLRRLSSVLFIMIPLFLAMLLTISTGVFFGIPFTFANVIVLPLLIGIGVDSGIHLVLRQRQLSAGELVHRTSTPRAVLVSALTTVASFGSMILLSHRGLSSLGAMLTIAMLYTLLCMLVVLPALFQLSAIRFRRNGV